MSSSDNDSMFVPGRALKLFAGLFPEGNGMLAWSARSTAAAAIYLVYSRTKVAKMFFVKGVVVSTGLYLYESYDDGEHGGEGVHNHGGLTLTPTKPKKESFLEKTW